MKKRIIKIIAAVLLVAAIAGTAVYSAVVMTPELSVEEEAKDGVLNPLTGEYVENLPSRPIMVSTDNVGDAIPQYGVSHADIVYEVPVEGAQSRLEVIYYSDIPKTVGPCRSVRPYIVDLAREYDAVLTHDGWSPDARSYLAQGIVADIPAQSNSFFYRTDAKSAPHNCLADTEDVISAAAEKGYDEPVDVRGFTFLNEEEAAVLSGCEEEYLAEYEKKAKEQLRFRWQKYRLPDLSGITFPENSEASEITVGYSNCTGKYEWNAEKSRYIRYANGSEYCDLSDGTAVEVSNVIVYSVSSSVLDQKGRLSINMCLGGDAWVFTQGRVFECSWSKKDLDSPTVFTDSEGNEIKLSAGKSWICVIDQNSRFEYR